ncbi:hypothetical protein CROQUDRAFT_605486 [Cronartium quercuum f. sp. fusiforme G11]|uniref:Uncharacterized protein n=1 Tax=Cronartium quercuum f. sp. fusiforme G11 TaxID=708437 RepID=A0A9P6N4S9_9BASI|nr:hypothetical protein CROQUDRAFT_605486 [Cronartium quercuum f. sp. fusiforme G11]
MVRYFILVTLIFFAHPMLAPYVGQGEKTTICWGKETIGRIVLATNEFESNLEQFSNGGVCQCIRAMGGDYTLICLDWPSGFISPNNVTQHDIPPYACKPPGIGTNCDQVD